MSKYFEFDGTISGTTYFLRNLIATFFAYCGGFLIGYGIGVEDSFRTVIGMVILAPTLWFNMCTIYKRSNALFAESANTITISMLVGQVFAQALPVINIALIVMGCILLFKNSNIEEQNG